MTKVEGFFVIVMPLLGGLVMVLIAFLILTMQFWAIPTPDIPASGPIENYQLNITMPTILMTVFGILSISLGLINLGRGKIVKSVRI